MNPFKPSTGATPPLLVGREPLLDDLAESFDDGPGAPGRVTIFTGARGVGKTVMLSEADDIALRRGWLSIDETATPGMLGRIDEQVAHFLDGHRPRPKRRLTGITLSAQLGAFTTQPTPDLVVGLRRKISKLLDYIGNVDPSTGLLITIDEVQSGIPDLRELAVIIQHLIREDRQIALVLAGLPSAVNQLLRHDEQDRVLTFLRRADRRVLADVPVEDVYDAFAQTIMQNGRTIDNDALEAAAQATFGYPFLIQLIGYHIWRVSLNNHIDMAAVRTGIEAARRRLGSLVHETALADLSDVDKTFLAAMSLDDGPSRIQDIRRRMGDPSSQHANRYRERLLAAQMIRQTGRGSVDFALPYLRDFLREHGAALGLDLDITTSESN